MSRLLQRLANDLVNYNDNAIIKNKDEAENICRQFCSQSITVYKQLQDVVNNYMRIINNDISKRDYKHALVTMRNLALNMARRPDFNKAMNTAYHIYDQYRDQLISLNYRS